MNKITFIFSIDKMKVEEGTNKNLIKGVLKFIDIDDSAKVETMLFKFSTASKNKVSEMIEAKSNNSIFIGFGRVSKIKDSYYINLTEINSIDKIKNILTEKNVEEEIVQNNEETTQDNQDEISGYEETFDGNGFTPPSAAKGVNLCQGMY